LKYWITIKDKYNKIWTNKLLAFMKACLQNQVVLSLFVMSWLNTLLHFIV